MERPVLSSKGANEGKISGVTYHVEGELVPVLTVDLDGGASVYYEHHILLWKHPSVAIGIKPMKGMMKRMMAGIQIFVTEAKGQGQIAFSRDGPGQIAVIHLKPGQGLHVREHQFLAATGNVEYSFERVKGAANLLMGGSGFFIDKFHAKETEGILWLHGYGNVFEKALSAGEQIDIEPGGWVYKDPEVKMETTVQRLSAGMLAGMNLVMNRFTGPGRVGLQSMYLHVDTAE